MLPACDTILVIDDNRDLRDGLRVVLSQDGYVVETAANGIEALTKLYGGVRPCIIVLDLMMPIMNGFEFRQKQLSDPTIAAIPVIAYSGITDPRATGQQLRAAAYLHKPIGPEQIAAAVRLFCPKEGNV